MLKTSEGSQKSVSFDPSMNNHSDDVVGSIKGCPHTFSRLDANIEPALVPKQQPAAVLDTVNHLRQPVSIRPNMNWACVICLYPLLAALATARQPDSESDFFEDSDNRLQNMLGNSTLFDGVDVNNPDFSVKLYHVIGQLAVAASAPILSLVAEHCSIEALYAKMVKDNTIQDLDAWVAQPEGPTMGEMAQQLISHWLSVGGHKPRSSAIPLAEQLSPYVPGLKLSVREGVEGAVPLALKELAMTDQVNPQPVVVGTIRMGFGHHRIAYAASSWALEGQHSNGDRPALDIYFHDFLNIDSDEADLVKGMDKWYSAASRLASNLGGPVEKVWDRLTLSGDKNLLRATNQMAEVIKPLLMDLPRDVPIIATHSLVALCAVNCGFNKVINLVIDNHPQWYTLAPHALNLVQGEASAQRYREMGVPDDELQHVGHWVPSHLVKNIDEDCDARIRRAANRGGERGQPLRVLISVGGAGAQRDYLIHLVRALVPKLLNGEVKLLFNTGDHLEMRRALENEFRLANVEYQTIDNLEAVRAFSEAYSLSRGDSEPSAPVTLFAFDDYFPAVATTDILCRVTDLLATKPSELAFYPIPKLFIRHVGAHESYSAKYSSELGDGTPEAEEVEEAIDWIKAFLEEGSPQLVEMNRKIKWLQAEKGLYNGCKNAIEIARQME